MYHSQLSLNSNLNLKYNAEDDYVYILKATNWIKWRKAGLNSIVALDKNYFNIDVFNSIINTTNGTLVLQDDGYYKFTRSGDSPCHAFLEIPIDVTNYTKIEMEYFNVSGTTLPVIYATINKKTDVTSWTSDEKLAEGVGKSGSTNGTVLVDLSSVTGEVYINIMISGGFGSYEIKSLVIS